VSDTIVIPPATAAQIRTGDTPCWDASLAKHHKALVSAGVTAWADEGKKLTARPRQPRKKNPVPAAK
jgi:hypothetical protein